MYRWWSLCPLYLLTCQVRVTVGDLYRDIFQVLINPLVGWFDKLKHRRKFMYLILYPQVQSMQESSTGDHRTRLCSPVNCVGVHVKSWQYSINMDHFYYTTYQLLTCYGWKSFSLSPEICILDLLKPFSSCLHVNEPQILPHTEDQAEKARCNTDACLIPWHASDFTSHSTFSADSYDVTTAPMCNHRHQHLHACYKSTTLAATPLLRHTKILHTP